ncbi:putative glycerol-3-phosphate transporter 1 [Elaeis guineensis]|uniref:Glycerol-3-phosphate transporter 1 n=1 Tax=Elaeis guineensis var. tenera TaxID=51953 RepID=A0A6I9S0F2_ELAGV|nr:putative glycerol-3-phosphate transporter 1 [Elaeis guineensis]
MDPVGDLQSETQCSKPRGICLLHRIKSSDITFRTYQAIVLVLTFVSYASYHATRKLTSIVKSVLDPKESGQEFSGWAPFNNSDGTVMLGVIDVAFLSAYSIAMYFAGHLGDRIDLRILLSIGMVLTAVFTSLFGVGYWLDIHSFTYYLVVQLLAGVFQSTGWPSVLAVMGNWFGKNRRGLIMGIWNANTSIGSIAGSLIASALLKYSWAWSFAIPGILMGCLGVIVFLFLPVSPEAVGIRRDGDGQFRSQENNIIEETLIGGEAEVKEEAVGFMEAWRIPGVALFALCLFFSKLVAYTFLYWLPFYISHTAIDGQYLSNSTAGILSTLFDVGGVFGGILAGHISDRLNARATTAACFTYCAIPALLFYHTYGSLALSWNATHMFIVGVFVNGPYALITTAVSADLGAHSSLKRSSRAMATVTAIINGTGSIGAAIGPLLAGYVSTLSWGAVFGMLMVAAFMAGLPLTRLVVAEVAGKLDGASRPPA